MQSGNESNAHRAIWGCAGIDADMLSCANHIPRAVRRIIPNLQRAGSSYVFMVLVRSSFADGRRWQQDASWAIRISSASRTAALSEVTYRGRASCR